MKINANSDINFTRNGKVYLCRVRVDTGNSSSLYIFCSDNGDSFDTNNEKRHFYSHKHNILIPRLFEYDEKFLKDKISECLEIIDKISVTTKPGVVNLGELTTDIREERKKKIEKLTKKGWIQKVKDLWK